MKELLLVGAGHAHVAVLRAFGMRPVPGVRLTLLTREVDTPYSGMLPGVIAGHYGFDDAHIDAGRLARFAGARLYHDEAVGLDVAGRLVLCGARPPVPFDIVSLDIGSRPTTGDVPGAAAHAIPVKPIDGFLARFDDVLARVRAARSREIVLVGGGAGGVELLLAIEHRLRREECPVRLTLVTDALLPQFPPRLRRRFAAIMAARGIAVRTGARVAAVEPGAVLLTDGTRVTSDETLWTTQAAPADWLAATGLPLEHGFLSVDATLRAAETVFAAGDMIAFRPGAIPRSGVYAVRAGPVLADNLRAALIGGRLKRYRPQRDALAIVTTGGRAAVMTRNGATAGGDWVWRLKDRIDRRWMARYNDLPEMADLDMRCGGCGAKVGATMLSRTLGRLAPAPRADVLIGLDAPDDAAVTDTGGALLTVHTVDYFRAMIDDPYRFGMIAANHALGDIYAMGAAPQTALAIATLPFGREAAMEADLGDMMRGANEILRAAGCALVGGHTGEGAELSLGFAVNGLVGRDRLLRKSGLQPGDALILTKPIGTGTLLAADMRGKARSRWVQAAIAHMTQSQAACLPILVAHAVRAATDVTGFGLLGHLAEMTQASGVDATLDLAAIPVLEGAEQTVAAGLFSSLQPENLRLGGAIHDARAAQRMPRFPLLFDPQTAGGLLAGVPAAGAERCVAALRAAGFAHAAIVGTAQRASGGAHSITLLDGEVRDAVSATRTVLSPNAHAAWRATLSR